MRIPRRLQRESGVVGNEGDTQGRRRRRHTVVARTPVAGLLPEVPVQHRPGQPP